MSGQRPLAGVILAGGKSSRMGVDKATLTIGGRSLLNRARDQLTAAGLKDIFVSGTDGIADRFPGRGPLSGVHAALTSLTERYAALLFVPVDMPAISPALLKRLAGADQNRMIVRFETAPLPFRLKTHPGLPPVLETIFEHHTTLSLRAFQDRPEFSRLSLPCGDPAALRNINTPEDWSAFQEIGA